MWNWYEYYVNSEGHTVYSECKNCKKYPAFSLTFKDDNEYGPFCRECWHKEIEKPFVDLMKRSNDEDWGSSPESRREFCEKCKKYPILTYAVYISSEEKSYNMCNDCFDKIKWKGKK